MATFCKDKTDTSTFNHPMQYLHLYEDIRQRTGKNNIINFVHSFYMTYVLYCVLPSIYAINQRKERAIKIEGHRKDEELIFKSSHRRQTNLQGNVGRFSLGGGEWEHEKYQPTKIMEKTKNIHTYGWPWETGRDLSAGVVSGEQDVSGLLSQTMQPWGTKACQHPKLAQWL